MFRIFTVSESGIITVRHYIIHIRIHNAAHDVPRRLNMTLQNGNTPTTILRLAQSTFSPGWENLCDVSSQQTTVEWTNEVLMDIGITNVIRRACFRPMQLDGGRVSFTEHWNTVDITVSHSWWRKETTTT